MRVLTNLSSKLELKQIFFLVFVFSLGLMGCEDQKVQTIKRVEYEPVYMSDQEFKNAVAMETPRELGKPGKIYFYNDYLFVNETNKGVHIIDNSDPSSPRKVGFINIPSNKDIAVKGDRLYADSHSDLLVFDIQDLENPELIKRIEGVFSFSATMVRGYPYQPVDHSKGIVVDWKKVEVEETCQGDCYNYRGGVLFDGMNASSGAVAESGGNSGVGGSMARFAITGDYLYAVDNINLLTFDISDQEPTKVDKQDLGWAIETIFPHEQNLYIGSESAMYIFDITTPETPKQMSIYTHLTACDPVVVEGIHAFVTLREGERCPRAVNRLEVIDVQDPYSPQKIAFYEMISPHGLGIDNGNLFVSEGEHGLKVMDASDPRNIKLLRHIKDLKTYDVIPHNNVLMVTGESGIVQYDYSDIENLNHLSTIPVGASEN